MNPGPASFTRKPARHRGSILLAVAVVLMLAALIGTTILSRVDVQREAAGVRLEQTQLRSLAWSGVQGVMAQLGMQRGAILDGGTPELTASWGLFSEGDGVQGSVRLVPMDGGQDLCLSESSKLDVNAASSEMLAKLPGMTAALAEAVVAARGEGFTSPESLTAVDGMTTTLLYGSGATDGLTAGGSSAAGAQGLRGLVTVFNFDPNVQAGAGGESGEEGVPRLDIGSGWTQEVEDALRKVLSESELASLKKAVTEGEPLKRDGQLVGLLRSAGVGPERLGKVLDLLTTTDDEFRVGRIDLSTAQTEVLATIPGLDEGAADKIVEARGSLTDEVRQDMTWPLREKIITPEAFEMSVDWLTTRSAQWRVRVEARIGRVDDAEQGGTPDDRATVQQGHSVVYEAVIDLSSPRARVAYLREVTFLELALARERGRAVAAEQSGEPENSATEVRSEETGTAEDRGVSLGNAPTDGVPEADDGLSFDELDLGTGSLGARRAKGEPDNADAAGIAGDMPGEAVAAPASEARPVRDRRIGRWTAGPRPGGS